MNLLDGRPSGVLEVWHPSTGLPVDISELDLGPERAGAVTLLNVLSRQQGGGGTTAGTGAVAGA